MVGLKCLHIEGNVSARFSQQVVIMFSPALRPVDDITTLDLHQCFPAVPLCQALRMAISRSGVHADKIAIQDTFPAN